MRITLPTLTNATCGSSALGVLQNVGDALAGAVKLSDAPGCRLALQVSNNSTVGALANFVIQYSHDFTAGAQTPPPEASWADLVNGGQWSTNLGSTAAFQPVIFCPTRLDTLASGNVGMATVDTMAAVWLRVKAQSASGTGKISMIWSISGPR